MPVILYRLTLKEPAIFAALEGEPNSAVSYDFVPGSAVRGMMIGQYMRSEKTNLDATNEEHRRLFFSDETRFLNAYPACDGERLAPVPSTWKRPKYLRPDETIIISDSVYRDNTDNSEEGRKPKALSGFTKIKDNTGHIYKTQRVINVHNTRARKSAHEQQVFRYDAIAPGQSFIGAIYCEDDDKEGLKKLLSARKQVNMGGARSAGYGLMSLELIDAIGDDWSEVPHNFAGDDIILTFLSDTILRDETGEYATTSEAIASALPFTCTVTAKSLKRTLIGGFNRKWGLPLPQVPAIERGSVIKLSNIHANEKQLRELTQLGFGEQRLDGFGRVALGWQVTDELRYQELKFEPEVVKESLSEESKAIWSRIRNKSNERTVNERMVGIVFSPDYVIHGRISKTQLARLRAIISDELRQETPSCDTLRQFLKDIEGKVAGKQFDDARMGNKSFSKWLSQPVFPELGQGLQERDRFVLQLVDAVLERAHKERVG